LDTVSIGFYIQPLKVLALILHQSCYSDLYQNLAVLVFRVLLLGVKLGFDFPGDLPTKFLDPGL